MGKDGCFGPAAHLYHQNPPTGWIDWEGTLKPRAFDTTKFADAVDCPWQARLLLGNAHVKYRHLLLTAAMDHLVRNGDGDELMFVHDGDGGLFGAFGHLSYAAGDYLLLARGTMWRLEPARPGRGLPMQA